MAIPKNLPQTVTDAYPSRWLHAADLDGKTLVVVIDDVNIEPIRNRSGGDDMKPVLTLSGLDKRLILNKTQCKALAQIAGTEVMNDWIGGRVRLAVGVAPNKKATILIQKAPQQSTPPPPQQGKPNGNGNGNAPKRMTPFQRQRLAEEVQRVYGGTAEDVGLWLEQDADEKFGVTFDALNDQQAGAWLKQLAGYADHQPEADQPETEAA